MGLWSAVSSSVGSSRTWVKNKLALSFTHAGSLQPTRHFLLVVSTVPDSNAFSQEELALPRRRAWLCIIHEQKQVGTEKLTQPVAPNILRSNGSPESSPSILVSEWQAAMQATNDELTILSTAALVSGGEKL